MFHSFRNRATCQHFLRKKPSLFSTNICPQRRNNLKLILSDFHKNASVFFRIVRKNFAALLFYRSVQTRIIYFELRNAFYIMKICLLSVQQKKRVHSFLLLNSLPQVTCIFRYSARSVLWFLCHHHIHILVRDLDPLFVKRELDRLCDGPLRCPVILTGRPASGA